MKEKLKIRIIFEIEVNVFNIDIFPYNIVNFLDTNHFVNEQSIIAQQSQEHNSSLFQNNKRLFTWSFTQAYFAFA